MDAKEPNRRTAQTKTTTKSTGLKLVRPEDLMYHEVSVLVEILRVLREVADLHDKV